MPDFCGLPGCGVEVGDSGRCSQCKSIVYCGVPHQREDWRRHKGVCRAARTLPQVGRWIRWSMGLPGETMEFTAEVLGLGEEESQCWDCVRGHYIEKTIYILIRYDNGEEDQQSQEDLKRYPWSYIETPDEEEQQRAKDASFNRSMGGLSCASCNCSTIRLHNCIGCNKVFYCNADCAAADWSSHRKDCKKERVARRPDPRYPLAQESDVVRAEQVKVQAGQHRVLQEALAGNFTVQNQRGGERVNNPKSGADLLTAERYILVIGQQEFYFKWRGLESPEHCIAENEVTSCAMSLYLEMDHIEAMYNEGGLHQLAGTGDEAFWYMLINFNTFGTVAKFHACHCNPSNTDNKMPPNQSKLRKKWNKVFKRAKADPTDVQCVFSNSRDGCHNFIACPYKHDIEENVDVRRQ